MKRIFFRIAVVAALVLALGYTLRTQITLRLMQRVLASNLETDLVRDLPDGLHVVLCGAGSPLPDPKRSGPCTAVIAGEHLFIVDIGSGANTVLGQLRVPRGDIDAIFLTHFHSDHIDGLGELLMQRWANSGSKTPTPVIGPEGVEEVVAGFNAAYRLDRGYRVAHHGPETVPPTGHGGAAESFSVPADGEGRVVFEEDGVKATAFRVNHEPIDPSVGYRFDYAGRSVVISGDTVKSANLESFSKGVDLLVHEGLAAHLVALITEATAKAGRPNLAKITADILDYHTTPVEAAEIARDANVGFLLYNHIVPPLLIATMEELFLEGVSDVYPGRHAIGRDGTLVSLPADSTTIDVEELL